VDLKPVLHIRDSLNFEASNALTNVTAFIKARLIGVTILLWIIFLVWSIRLFDVSGKTINLVYLLAETIFTLLAISVSYNLVNRVIPIIVMIGRRVSITNEMVSITTFTFNLRFWNKKPPQTLVFKINELRIRKTDNPLRFIRIAVDFDNRVFELCDKTNKAYIVFDYFDAKLKEKLTEILVEVTPLELLIPGRIRHY
jgi:hypothetical protein